VISAFFTVEFFNYSITVFWFSAKQKSYPATPRRVLIKKHCEPRDGVSTLTDKTAANPDRQPSDFFLNDDVASDVRAVNNYALVRIISPKKDKPKKKKNKKKRVEKDE